MAVDDVCREAGLSKGAFYGYFPAKQDLLEALLEGESQAMDAEISRIESTHASMLERLVAFTHVVMTRGEDPARTRLRLDLYSTVLTDPGFGEVMARQTDTRRAPIERWVEAAMAGATAAERHRVVDVCLSLCTGLLIQASSMRGLADWENTAPVVRRMIGAALHR